MDLRLGMNILSLSCYTHKEFCAEILYQSSVATNAPYFLTIEWTNQHSCGGNEDNDPHKPKCNLVIQYMVQDYDGSQAGAGNY